MSWAKIYCKKHSNLNKFWTWRDRISR